MTNVAIEQFVISGGHFLWNVFVYTNRSNVYRLYTSYICYVGNNLAYVMLWYILCRRFQSIQCDHTV